MEGMDSSDGTQAEPRTETRTDWFLIAGITLFVIGLFTLLTATSPGIPPLSVVGVALIAVSIVRRFATIRQ